MTWVEGTSTMDIPHCLVVSIHLVSRVWARVGDERGERERAVVVVCVYFFSSTPTHAHTHTILLSFFPFLVCFLSLHL